MSLNIYLRLDTTLNPPITFPGESLDKSRPGAIELLEINWNGENAASLGSATSGAGAGKATLKKVTMTKRVDSVTPKLFQMMSTGAHTNAQIEVVQAASPNGGAVPIFSVQFKLCFITHQEFTVSSGDDAMIEQLFMVYGAEQQSFTPVDKGVLVKPVIGQWNQVTNSTSLIIPGN